MFVIGSPGKPPRLLQRGDDAAIADEQRQDGEVVVSVASFGDYVIAADGLSVMARQPTLAELRAARLAELAAISAPRLAVWAAPSGGLQIDDISTARINAWATMALVTKAGGGDFTLPYWIMADNSHRTFTGADDFLAFAAAAAAYKTAAVLHNATLKAAIAAASDADALAAIALDAGWPE